MDSLLYLDMEDREATQLTSDMEEDGTIEIASVQICIFSSKNYVRSNWWRLNH